MKTISSFGRQAVRSILSHVLLAALVLGANAALAQAPTPQKFENLDRIDGLVAMTVGANLGQPGGPIAPVDRRLHLAACPQTPSIDGPVFGAAIVKCDALGWRIRVPLAAGGAASATVQSMPPVARKLAGAAVSRDIVVKRGDPVQLQAGGAAFSISRMMIADEDGAPGQMIRVREDKKSTPVIAQVMELGVVRIPGFKEY
jgi:flagella basal body P-ring formation protein FlgA